ncbi:cobalt-precorrin-5B (C(1))-methyltransferase CbiD [Chamaesiphon minutus]|uniref:Cobalt-precorrin-5B C(1)-methyltransferase n=1 Tax=Chamaesiphon minutus (strain ATCC 27169 / PCC 6605) TaxID=1173020 RepID=K9UJA7_CHAP6|nr:cobalt-precorrin-5B (C(1))-methyltransferase CbiD [Chamaesiphon minutus]AFY94541.1 cobalamin biosynthesis protein CbiD [Chamaesiphon minutus PCC 6605]
MRSGYTLPVFATASAIAALQCLQQSSPTNKPVVTIDLITPPQRVEISIAQVALIQSGMALGITHSDPGDNLDLTRDTPVWAVVEWADPSQVETIALVGGEGVGKQSNLDDLPAIYKYARQLLQANLGLLLTPAQKIRVTIILPAGRILATRTSNAAFGVVEGLSLLGTTGISQPLSAPGQLEACLTELRGKWGEGERGKGGDSESLPLVFCIGENGLDLAQQMGIKRDRIIKTANWLGPLLAEAGSLGVPKLLLFGYHGKLIKLAGGIFHTHHHLADGRLEILVAAAARMGLPAAHLSELFDCETAEDVLKYLQISSDGGSNWVTQIYGYLTERIDNRSQTYIYSQSQQSVSVGSVVFDRQRRVIATSPTGRTFLTQLC